MKSILFYAAAAIVVIAAAVFVWAKFFSKKDTSPDYDYGRARGPESGFMDPSTAQSGVTPIKANLEGVTTLKPNFGNAWFGKTLEVKSTVPTANPVRTQNKTIW
jgi:hypothetical protein